jgi:hypothetical protein
MPKITMSLFGELALLPYPAMIGASESIEYLTEIIESHDGTEQRQQLRSLPRQTLSYSYPITKDRMAAAFNMQYGAIAKNWAVPLWAEGQDIAQVLAHETSIACDTTIHDLRPNSLALLRSNDTVWQIIEISTITATSISVSNDLKYQQNARLYPVRIGWTNDPIERKVNGVFVNSSMKFKIDDLREVAEIVPGQYLGDDIYFACPLLGGDSLGRSLQQRIDILDQSLGVIARRTPWSNARYSTPLYSLLKSKQEIYEYRTFLSRCQGKFRAFWMPSFEFNMSVMSVGTVSNTVLIKPDSYLDYAPRTHIAIKTNDGTYHTNTITASSVVAGGLIQLTLTTALNIDASTIQKISYLGLYRLDTDSIDLIFIGKNMAQTQVNIIELKA